jgi:hypothetical protein
MWETSVMIGGINILCLAPGRHEKPHWSFLDTGAPSEFSHWKVFFSLDYLYMYIYEDRSPSLLKSMHLSEICCSVSYVEIAPVHDTG